MIWSQNSQAYKKGCLVWGRCWCNFCCVHLALSRGDGIRWKIHGICFLATEVKGIPAASSPLFFLAPFVATHVPCSETEWHTQFFLFHIFGRFAVSLFEVIACGVYLFLDWWRWNLVELSRGPLPVDFCLHVTLTRFDKASVGSSDDGTQKRSWWLGRLAEHVTVRTS